MNSYRQNEGRRRLFIATIFVFVVFGIDALLGGRVRGLVRAGGGSLYSAGARTLSGIADSGFFSSRRTLSENNRSLREQVAELEVRAAAVQVLRDENASLRAVVRLAEAEKGITAPIISSVRSSPFGTFSIGAGTKDGVMEGSLVMTNDAAGGGFVVGRVRDVGKRTALVLELFAPNTSVPVVIRGASAFAEGRGGGNARAEIPRGLEVASGDAVTSRLFGGRAVGIVGSVYSDQSSATSEVYIGLPVGLAALQFVYVIPPGT
ncbi:MAG: rod shape-determining protein MreC [Patescibacteria group bacterium]